MKNKKLIIGGIIAMAIIGLYLYFAVKKAKATATNQTQATNPDPSTVLNLTETPGSSGKIATNPQESKTTSVLQLPSWLNWLAGPSGSPTPGSEQYSVLYDTNKFPLKYGSQGSEVLNLQKYLNNHVVIPFTMLKEDSIFGILTQAALLRTEGVMQVSEQWYKANILNLS